MHGEFVDSRTKDGLKDALGAVVLAVLAAILGSGFGFVLYVMGVL